MKLLWFVGILWLIFATGEVGAREVKMKPRWMKTLPRPGNTSYYFKVVYTDAAANLEVARVHARKELALSIERNEHIRIDESLEYQSTITGNTGNENAESDYSFQVVSEGDKQYLRYERVDEYWESCYEQGKNVIRLYTLFVVGRQMGQVNIERFTTSTQYGARGMVRSIIPGWGQMYKESMVKGGSILGGEIVCIGAIIVAENQRASYVKKMKENPRHIKSYNSKADNWENIRNVCIGAAAALYVYNLIDAIIAQGAPRLVKDKQHSFAFAPIIAPKYNGISLVYKF